MLVFQSRALIKYCLLPTHTHKKTIGISNNKVTAICYIMRICLLIKQNIKLMYCVNI